MSVLTPLESNVCRPYFQQFVKELKKEGFPVVGRSGYKCRRYFPTGVQPRHHRWVYAHGFDSNGTAWVYVGCPCGKKSEAKVMFKALLARKKIIDSKWPGLEWNEPKNSFVIGVERQGYFFNSEKKLGEIREWAVGEMLKLADAIPKKMLEDIAKELANELGKL